MYGGQSTYIPLRINQGGVIPIIFASSVLLFPATIAQLIPNQSVQRVVGMFSPSGSLYMVFYFALIFFFTYFYTAITFNPKELAENIKKYGGFVTGIRPGAPTAQYPGTHHLPADAGRRDFPGADRDRTDHRGKPDAYHFVPGAGLDRPADRGGRGA